VKVAEPPATEIVAAVHCGGAVYAGEIAVVLELEEGRFVGKLRLDEMDDWLVVLGKADELRLDEDDTIVEVEDELGIADGWALMLVLVVIELDVDNFGLLVDWSVELELDPVVWGLVKDWTVLGAAGLEDDWLVELEEVEIWMLEGDEGGPRELLELEDEIEVEVEVDVVVEVDEEVDAEVDVEVDADVDVDVDVKMDVDVKDEDELELEDVLWVLGPCDELMTVGLIVERSRELELGSGENWALVDEITMLMLENWVAVDCWTELDCLGLKLELENWMLVEVGAAPGWDELDEELEAVNRLVSWITIDVVEVEESSLVGWVELDENALDTEKVKSWLLEGSCEGVGRSELNVDTRAVDDIPVWAPVT
jgi:hypothetical protein